MVVGDIELKIFEIIPAPLWRGMFLRNAFFYMKYIYYIFQ